MSIIPTKPIYFNLQRHIYSSEPGKSIETKLDDPPNKSSTAYKKKTSLHLNIQFKWSNLKIFTKKKTKKKTLDYTKKPHQ